MMHLFWHFLANPYVLLIILAVAFAGSLIFHYIPGLFMRLLVDIRVWLAVIAVAGVVGFMSLSKQNDTLQDQLKHQKQGEQIHTDATTVINHYITRIVKVQGDSQRRQTVIDKAPPEQAHDLYLDEVARAQGNPIFADLAKQPELTLPAVPDRVQPHPDGVIRP